MDIRLISSDNVKEKVNKLIKNSSIKISEDAKVVLVERGYEQPNECISIVFDAIDYYEAINIILNNTSEADEFTLTGFYNNRYTLLNISDVQYIEVNASQVKCITEKQSYELKNALNYYENKFRTKGMVRINKSQLVNMLKVKEIIPWFNSRLVIVLHNNQELEVSKLYSKTLRKLLNL